MVESKDEVEACHGRLRSGREERLLFDFQAIVWYKIEVKCCKDE